MRYQLHLFSLPIVIALLNTTGCPGSLDHATSYYSDAGTSSTGASPALCKPSDVPTQILAMNCGKSGCHSGTQAPDLQSANVATRLQGMKASECTDSLWIDPANPEQSAIYKKIIPNPTCGSTRMPSDGPPYLSDDQVACVKSWIASLGANATAAGGAPSSGSAGSGGAAGGAGGQ